MLDRALTNQRSIYGSPTPDKRGMQSPQISNHIAPIAQLVSALDLVTSSVQVEGSILTAGKRLSLKNLNVIIRAIN